MKVFILTLLLTLPFLIHAQTPGGVGGTGLKLWLRANQSVYHGSGAEAVDGDTVKQWLDAVFSGTG